MYILARNCLGYGDDGKETVESEGKMYKTPVRPFFIFTILAVLISQFGLMPTIALVVSAAPAWDEIPTNPSFAGVTISNVKINGGSNTEFVSPGSTFSLSMDYSIVDTACPGCIDQIEIGYSTSDPFTCIYDDVPGPVGESGSATINVTAPSTPGVYYLGFDRAQHYSCAQALAVGWWNDPPDPNRYIASVITARVVNSAADTDDETCDVSSCTLREAINAANASSGLDSIVFNIPGAGIKTISPASALPAITDPVIIDGYSQPGASPNTLATGNDAAIQIELDGDSCTPAPCAQALLISSGSSAIKGLAIHGNFNNGIEVNGSGSTIAGNFIGLRADGSAHGVAASGVYVNNTSDNTIGGTAPAGRNVISANRDGIFFAAGLADTTGNVVQGNYIGTDPAGEVALGNTQRGIFIGSFGFTANNNTIGETAAGAGNLISGNGHFGILLRDGNVMGNFMFGNRIGVDANGDALPNGGGAAPPDGLALTAARAGVYIAGPGNAIGGVAPGEGNTIAFNAGIGVGVGSGTGNAILGNSIYSNDDLGIDLGGDDVTFNHLGAIAGPNNYQNYPVLTVATSDGETTRLVGTLESEASQTYAIEVYANPACDPTFFGEGQTFLDSFDVTTDSNGLASFDQTIAAGVDEPVGITTIATGPSGTSEFSYCRPVATSNLNWAQAQAVTGNSQTQQYITDRFQEKWFKFPVGPGSQVQVQLTGLPGSAVSLHVDPFPIYNGFINPGNAAVLAAEAADAAFLPSGSLPSGSLPSGSLPSGSLPSGSLPSGSLPTGYLPSGSLPSGSLPSGSLPSGSLPSGSLPSGSLPSGSLPSGSLPSGSLPSGSLPSGSLPSGSLPSGSLPSGSLPSGSLPSGSLDAYASAARRSLLGISMNPYSTVQTIARNTYDLQEDLYVRVVAPYNLETPFTLDITVQGGICGGVQPVPSGLAVIFEPAPAPGSFQSLILTDSGRLSGTSAEIADALADLGSLAGRADVNGIVIDLADPKYERVAFANAEADDNLGCAFAKNTVASEIKKVIEAYRAANPTLEYIVLAGGADVIPFFQVQDVSGLANEKEYVVPVAPSTASEAGLKTNLVQGQDGYGSQVDITQAGHTLALPDLAIGRLVESASDISAAVAAYIQTGGVIMPNSSLVTGYDFVGDAAVAIQDEMEAGTNSVAETLIQPPGEPPTGPNTWTADDLRLKLGGDFDIAMLSGHFSAGSLLAADYATILSAAELEGLPVDLSADLILALGCHGGYTIPGSDLLPDVSPDPDWAKAFLSVGAAGYISATGYAYGDTELTEYGERLFLLMAQQLRTGSGPVSVGQAIVKAKLQYLAETAQLTGIDHKTLVEMTLYGFPMLKVNMPGARITPPTQDSIVTIPANQDSVCPGARFGLVCGTAEVTFSPDDISPNPVPLLNLDTSSTVQTTYLSGPDGVIANPFEPIFPKAIYDVSVSSKVLRGVAFRGGTYIDEESIIPLTSAPTTETSRTHLSFNTDVFYPTQVWMANFIDAIDGGKPRLVTIPAQFRSSALGAIDGTLREYNALNFRTYYLDGNWTSSGAPATKAAAVSAAPNIQGASAVLNGSDLTFSVNVVSEGSAGIQSVWVLFTGKPGSSYYGTWTPLDLVQSTDDPTLWEETLSLPLSENAEDILFMVQAIGGAGLTTLATNLGAYYSLTPATPPQDPPDPTVISLQASASGTYLHESTFTLSLTSNGQPLASQLVTLDVAGQQALAFTDSGGEATIHLTLIIPPGNYTAQASFRGNAQYLGSNDASDFTVNKESTTLTVTPVSASILAGQPTPFVAVVHDSFTPVPRALGGKSVFFIVRQNGVLAFAKSVIADYLGNAMLGEVPLPPGDYRVFAYFNGEIPVDPALTLSDDYYESSNDLGPADLGFPLTIVGDTTPPTITASASKADNTPYTAGVWTNQDVTVHFTCSDSGSGVASCPADQTYSTDGEFTATGIATDNANNSASASFGPIRIDKTDPTLSPSVTPNPVYLNGIATASAGATDSGSGIASQSCGVVNTSSVGSKTVACNATDNTGNTTTSSATYRVIYRFIGFLPPINIPGHTESCGSPCPVHFIKGNSTLPVKFQLKDANGTVVRPARLPVWLIPDQGSVIKAPVDESLFSPGIASAQTFKRTGQQYHFNWKTKGFATGYYWRIGVKLDDGQTYYVVIGLRK
jgi:CSLREA domain-containing protein